MIPQAVSVKAYLIFFFLFRRELEVVYVWLVWKNQSFSSRFCRFEMVIWGLSSLMSSIFF